MPIKSTRSDFDKLVDNLYDYSIEFEIREDYSGRGMYGRTCIGFTTDDPMRLAIALGAILMELERSADDDGEEFRLPFWSDLSPSMDSMGLSSIVYFPNWSVE